MPTNDGSGTFWQESDPAVATPVSGGSLQIRDLRLGVRLRAKKEHLDYGDSTAGGEHKQGSAVSYFAVGASPPSLRPDGATTLTLDGVDDGRLWLNTTNNGLYFFDSAGANTGIGGTNWFGTQVINIPTGFIQTTMIANQAVTETQMATASVGTAEIIDGSITTAKLALQSVDSSKIADGTIGATQLGAAVVGLTELGGDVLALLANKFLFLGSYTGNSGTQTISGVGFKPDFLVIIRLDSTGTIGFTIRTADSALYKTDGTKTITGTLVINNDGFAITSSTDASLNQNGKTYKFLAIKAGNT